MDWKEKEVPEKKWVETGAGFVRIVDSTPKSFSEISRFYDIILKPSASPEEINIGKITAQLKKVGDLKNSSIYTAISRELGDDKTIAEIFRFYPFGVPSLRKLRKQSPEAEQLLQTGLATAALNLVLGGLKSSGAAGVYMHALEEPARNLLSGERFNFQEIDRYYYFKKL